MFAKKLTELTQADIQNIIGRKVQEDQEVEFKKTLPTEDGKDDRWIKQGDEIGRYAKRYIAKVLIAFANTLGGILILGVGEDGEDRASEINPLPKCRILADRLAASVASSTDPKLYGIEYAGIELENDKGVVVFRVSPSARAPHRDTDTRESYYRSGAKSEPMDMHRIQAMSVEKWRGLQLIETRLQSRSFNFTNHFSRQFHVSTAPGKREIQDVTLWVAGIRATAIPIDRISVKDIARREPFKLADAPLIIERDTGKPESLHSPEVLSWKPILRGMRAIEENADWAQFEERAIYSDGLIEMKAKTSEYFVPEDGESSRRLSAGYLLGPIAQFLVMVDCFRNVVGRPDLEYAIAIEWRIPTPTKITLPTSYWGERAMSSLQEHNELCDLVMPSTEGISDFWTELQTDFFQSLGRTYGNIFPINFEKAISHVMERSNAVM